MKEHIPYLINAVMLGFAWAMVVQYMVSRQQRLKLGRFLVFIFFAILTYLISYLMPFEILGLIVWFLMSSLLIIIDYRVSFIQSILYGFTFILLDIVGQIIPTFYKHTRLMLVEDKHPYMLNVFDNLVVMLMCLIFILLWHFLTRNPLKTLYKKIYTLLENFSPGHVVITFIFLMIIISMTGLIRIYKVVLQFSNGKIQFAFFIILILLPVINLLGFLLYKLAIRNKIKLDEQKKEYDQLLLYTGIIEKLTRDMRAFRHDFNNILLTLRGFIEQNDVEGLKAYYFSEILKNQSVTQNVNNVFLKFEYIKSIPLKGLLTSGVQRALNLNLKVSILLDDYLGDTGMEIFDLCRIMGIFLDNAIEAASNSEEKVISVSILQDQGMITSLIIANSFSEKPDMSQLYREGYSTKGADRGVGLSTLKAILNNYPHVTLNTVIENQFFIQEINFTHS